MTPALISYVFSRQKMNDVILPSDIEVVSVRVGIQGRIELA